MKCPICDGTGIEKIYDERTNAYLHIPCATCHKTGYINQTNEEWFDELSTEEKAMVIICCCPYESDWFGENFEKRMEQRIKNLSQSAQGYGLGIQKIKAWLKQPHTKEVK